MGEPRQASLFGCASSVTAPKTAFPLDGEAQSEYLCQYQGATQRLVEAYLVADHVAADPFAIQEWMNKALTPTGALVLDYLVDSCTNEVEKVELALAIATASINEAPLLPASVQAFISEFDLTRRQYQVREDSGSTRDLAFETQALLPQLSIADRSALMSIINTILYNHSSDTEGAQLWQAPFAADLRAMILGTVNHSDYYQHPLEKIVREQAELFPDDAPQTLSQLSHQVRYCLAYFAQWFDTQQVALAVLKHHQEMTIPVGNTLVDPYLYRGLAAMPASRRVRVNGNSAVFLTVSGEGIPVAVETAAIVSSLNEWELHLLKEVWRSQGFNAGKAEMQMFQTYADWQALVHHDDRGKGIFQLLAFAPGNYALFLDLSAAKRKELVGEGFLREKTTPLRQEEKLIAAKKEGVPLEYQSRHIHEAEIISLRLEFMLEDLLGQWLNPYRAKQRELIAQYFPIDISDPQLAYEEVVEQVRMAIVDQEAPSAEMPDFLPADVKLRIVLDPFFKALHRIDTLPSGRAFWRAFMEPQGLCEDLVYLSAQLLAQERLVAPHLLPKYFPGDPELHSVFKQTLPWGQTITEIIAGQTVNIFRMMLLSGHSHDSGLWEALAKKYRDSNVKEHFSDLVDDMTEHILNTNRREAVRVAYFLMYLTRYYYRNPLQPLIGSADKYYVKLPGAIVGLNRERQHHSFAPAEGAMVADLAIATDPKDVLPPSCTNQEVHDLSLDVLAGLRNHSLPLRIAQIVPSWRTSEVPRLPVKPRFDRSMQDALDFLWIYCLHRNEPVLSFDLIYLTPQGKQRLFRCTLKETKYLFQGELGMDVDTIKRHLKRKPKKPWFTWKEIPLH